MNKNNIHTFIIAGAFVLLFFLPVKYQNYETGNVVAPEISNEMPEPQELYFTNQELPNFQSITPGVLTLHNANSDIAYNWFTYIPASLSKSELTHIWISGLHGNIQTGDYGQITEESRNLAEGNRFSADKYHYVLLVPVIPRIPSIYVVSFTWKVFLESTDLFYQRPDEKVNLMIDRLTSDLENAGYNVHNKVLMDGFSAGAMFTQRYALLHPERVQALAAGQCGGAMTLPEDLYDATQLDWPVGTNDFPSLIGSTFNQEAYKQIPQYIYIGDQDTTTSTLLWTGELWRTQDQIDFLNSTFGNTDPVRIENQVAYLNSIGYDKITFRKYVGVGHQMTSEMANDTFAFFENNKAIPNPKPIAPQDGHIFELSENSNTGWRSNATSARFYVGDDQRNRQYLSILSFDTSSLPDDAVILSATLNVKRMRTVGTNPFDTHSNLLVEIGSPCFGGSCNLEASDFQASAQAMAGNLSSASTDNWHSAVLDAAVYPYINLIGKTQFRLRFELEDNNDRGMDAIQFLSGNAPPDDRPQLIIEYYVP